MSKSNTNSRRDEQKHHKQQKRLAKATKTVEEMSKSNTNSRRDEQKQNKQQKI
jgi:hypothetical protein